jgi:hypothetical protein
MVNPLCLLLALSAPGYAWKTFVVPHNNSQDDVPALSAALGTGNYSQNTTILFEKGITYNIFSPIKFPVFNNVEIAIEGNLTYPKDIPTIQGMHGILETCARRRPCSFSCCGFKCERISVQALSIH